MDTLLRRYEPEECGTDGYPHAWHKGEVVVSMIGSPDEHTGTIDPPIKDLIREQANNRCQRCRHPYTKGEIEDGWSDCDGECKHFGGEQRGWNFETHQWVLGRNDQMSAGQLVSGGRRMQARWRILTVHHLDEDKRNCLWWNLVALCQRCHLRMQRAVVLDRPWLYEHSDWFKPYAAGFYAWKYEQAELDRGEVEARLDELLAYELRFKQERMILEGI